MKAGRLDNHLRIAHSSHVKSNLQYFKTLKIVFRKKLKDKYNNKNLPARSFCNSSVGREIDKTIKIY